MRLRELTDQIYDTLLENYDLLPGHPKLDVGMITNQEVLASAGSIYIEIDNKVYLLQVIEVNCNHFREE